MKLKDLFLEVFREELEGNAFHFKNNLFYRMNGTILQGIALDSLRNHYYVRCMQLPYWCFHLTLKDTPLKKARWAIYGKNTSFGIYLKDNTQENAEGMQGIFSQFKNDFLPILNEVDDERKYLDTLQRLSGAFSSEEYALLYVSYLDGSWDYFREWLEKQREAHMIQAEKNALRSLKTQEDFRADPPPGYDVVANARTYEQIMQQEIERFESSKEKRYGLVLRKMQENDIQWIKAVYEQESAVMRNELQRDLNLIL